MEKTPEGEFERLGQRVTLAVCREHRFGIDAFLLSDFAQAARGENACDLCSGCGIVAALWFRQEDTAPKKAVCVELQPKAAALIEKTAALSGLAGRLVSVQGDLTDIRAPELPAAGFDVVTCNPPYKAAGSGIPSQTQPKLLARHERTDGFFTEVCRTAKHLLRYRGRLCVCGRPERLCDMLESMRKQGLEPKRLRFVHKRPETPPWLVLIEARRGCRPFLEVQAPLLVHSETGGFSDELRAIYRLEETKREEG